MTYYINIIVNIELVYTFGYSFMTYIQLTQYLMDMTNHKLARVGTHARVRINMRITIYVTVI